MAASVIWGGSVTYSSEFTCIIPAKGSSSRLPDKNRLLCAGVPLVEWAYRIAQQSKMFGNILVSTDSIEILALARRLGHEHLYLRPKEMASVYSPVEDAIAHALSYLEGKGQATEYVCLLHPTSPCLRPESVEKALRSLWMNHAQMIVSVSDADVPLNVMKPLCSSMRGFLTNAERVSHTHQKKAMVKLNNAIVAGQWDIFKEKKDYYQTDIIPYFLSKTEAIDIDDAEDFRIAEGILLWRRIYENRKSVSGNLRPMQPADVSQTELDLLSSYAGCGTDQ